MKLLMQYLGRYKPMIFLALVLAAINQSFSLLNPIISGKLLNQFVNHPHSVDAAGLIPRDMSGFISQALVLIGAFIGFAMVSRIAKNFQDYVVNVVIQKYGARMYTDGLRHALRLPYQDFEDQSSGKTQSVLLKVRSDCEKFVNAFFNVLLPTIIGLIFVFVYTFKLNPFLPLVYLGGGLILALLISVLSKRIKAVQKSIVMETNALAGSTTESLRNIELVKSLGLTNQEIRRLNATTIKILNLELKKVRSIRTIAFIQGTFVNFLQQVIILTLLYFVFKDTLSPGDYLTLTFFSFFVLQPMQEIGNIIIAYREAEASLQNLEVLLNKPTEYTPENPKKINGINEVRFDKVVFKHNTASQPALNGISFDVKLGETIAFVGPSGSGKTTLVKLLVGLYHPIEGHIYYNGYEGAEINFEELRANIGLVTQDAQLFSGSLKENLLFVNPTATDEDLTMALHSASCQNLLERAEKGLDTVIGEGGLKLSGGERQRLSIARALLRKPRLMIFDEATSALDSLTEEEISQTVRAITSQRNHLTIMIAHRLSTIMHADRIYVLEKGEVIETGSHASLLEEKGLYYAMWRQQIGERQHTRSNANVKV
jgi:ATP-binding cassette, subfamily B, bacterial